MDEIEDKRKAGKIGGARRAEILPPDRRAEIARKAAESRWGLKATNKGSFKQAFGVDVDCYVLDDPQKTAVISQRGMGEAIGFSRRGSRLTVFVNSKTMDDYIGRDLREKLENPLVFQPVGAAAGTGVSARANGYDAAILIDICQAIVNAKADGKLTGQRYEKMTEQARIIIGASAKNGIRHLVYALAGYSPSAEEVIEAFKHYVQEEAKKYEREFPNELYREWHRLYQIPVPLRGKPWQFKHLTVKHIWFPLAKSNGKILELVRALKAKDGDRQKKLFQFLNDVGGRALGRHIGRVQEIAETSASAAEYESRINNRFGDQRELDFVTPPNVVLPPARKPDPLGQRDLFEPPQETKEAAN